MSKRAFAVCAYGCVYVYESERKREREGERESAIERVSEREREREREKERSRCQLIAILQAPPLGSRGGRQVLDLRNN